MRKERQIEMTLYTKYYLHKDEYIPVFKVRFDEGTACRFWVVFSAGVQLFGNGLKPGCGSVQEDVVAFTLGGFILGVYMFLIRL